MSLRSVFSILFILVFYSSVITTIENEIEIRLTADITSASVWEHDAIIINKIDGTDAWFFNGTDLAKFSISQNKWMKIITTLTYDITTGVRDTKLILRKVNRTFTGSYEAEHFNTVRQRIDLTVHEINLTQANFRVIGDLNRCNAYLELSESIEPHSSNVSRKISSSDFIPALVSTSDSNLFVLPNESIVFTQNEKNVSIDVEYSFKNTNYSIKQQTWAKIEKTIQPPNITAQRNATSCSIRILHDPSLPCVRRIQYCLPFNDVDFACANKTDKDEYIHDYPLGTKLVTGTVSYDVIYAYWTFNVSIDPCFTEASSSDSNSLPGWAIALIVIGCVLFLLIIAAIIGYCIWRKKSQGKPASDIPMRRRMSTDATTTRKTIPHLKRAPSNDSLPSVNDPRGRRGPSPRSSSAPVPDPFPILAQPRPRYHLAPATSSNANHSQWPDRRREIPPFGSQRATHDDADPGEVLPRFSPFDSGAKNPRKTASPRHINYSNDDRTSIGSDRIDSGIL